MAAASLLLLSSVLVALLAINSAAKQMNVLFFAVDDLRPELGTYGYSMIKSPNIDDLASKSMVFERAYCQVAVCSPSRASLLTGRRPDTNHVWKIAADEYWRMYTNATTIPQYFKENGYISIGMGKIFHPGAPSGNDDVKYSWSPEGLPYFHAKEPSANGTSWHSFEDYKDDQLQDGLIADNAISVLQALKQNETKGDDRPFFVAVGFHKPHLPFYAPSKYFDLYPSADETELPPNPDPPKDMPDVAWSVWGELRSYTDIKKLFVGDNCTTDAQASIFGKQCRLPDSITRELRRAYYSCISFTDAQIGRVIQELEKQGFADNTIIVLWADHGWQLGEHGEWCKHTNFEDATHVPFLLHVPGVTDKGMRSTALVELIDIFPTLTELAGIKQPPVCPENNKDILACVEGTSVVPLLKDPDQKWKKAAFSQYARPDAGLETIPGHPSFPPNEHGESVMGYTIRVDNYRFTDWYRFNRTTAKPDFNNIWDTELYDHTNPASFFNDENENLAKKPEMKSVVEELRNIVQAGWRNAVPEN